MLFPCGYSRPYCSLFSNKLVLSHFVTFSISFFPVLQAVIILLQNCRQAVAKLIMMTASQQLDHDDKLLQS